MDDPVAGEGSVGLCVEQLFLTPFVLHCRGSAGILCHECESHLRFFFRVQCMQLLIIPELGHYVFFKFVGEELIRDLETGC